MKKRIFSLLLCLCMVLTLVPMSALADVTTPQTWYVNGSYAGGESDGSADKPFTTVAAAIAAASEGDTVSIAAGTYDAFIVNKANLTFVGEVDAGNNLVTIKTMYKDNPTLTDNGNTTGWGGVEIRQNASFENLNFISYGYAVDAWAAGYGAPISVNFMAGGTAATSLSVKDCNFKVAEQTEGNATGSAIFMSIPTVTITGCTFEGFDVAYYAMCDGGAVNNLTVSNNTFTNIEYPVSVYYGGVIDENAAGITITDNTIQNDDADATSTIVIHDYAQSQNLGAGIAATITGNTAGTEITLTHVNMTVENDITLDANAAAETTVLHAVAVEKGDYASVTVTTADGDSITVTKNQTVNLPVSTAITFKDASGAPIVVTGAAPVTLTYTSQDGTTITETIVVVPGSGGSTTNKVYQITFHAGGGNASSTMLYTDTAGLLSGLPTAYRGGYNFDGWYTEAVGGTEITAATVFTADTVVYAHWTQQIIPQMRMDNFATTTGEFKDVEYFGTAVKPGDMVTLKVSTSDFGDQYGLDYHKITVVYETEGAVIVNNNYDYSGDPIYKDGIATDFVLNEGLNNIVAKIYYNGVYCGAFAPFYTLI